MPHKLTANVKYYAGDEIVGNRLEDIGAWDEWGTYPKKGELDFTFFYGDCDPPDGLFAEGGCAPRCRFRGTEKAADWKD